MRSSLRVLVVTGRLAQDLVASQAASADVLVMDVDVAAFITPKMLLQAAPQGYDLILIPGAITAGFEEVERELDTKVRLGPKHAADLGFVLSHLDGIELSTNIPACVLLEGWMRREAESMAEALETAAEPGLLISGVKIGGRSRMKVLAELVDATRLSPQALAGRIHYYQEQGADMIDLGLPLGAKVSSVSPALKAARAATDLPLSVDTVSPDLILAGLDGGADLVLSLDGHNLGPVGEAVAAAGIPAVVIPGPGAGPLEENLRRAQELGIRVIADPVLDPPLQGLSTSLQRYSLFREAHPDIPLFFGAGNVTELLDADGTGANALLAAMAAELGTAVLFTPEYSDKARGSVRELVTASKMMLLAKMRRTPPKDLGLDLLVLKEKRRRPDVEMAAQFQAARSSHEYELDPAGSVRVALAEGQILARHGRAVVVGTSAAEILNTLIDCGLVSRLDHAGYLGRELCKAEMALRLGRSYSQDEPLFGSLEKLNNDSLV